MELNSKYLAVLFIIIIFYIKATELKLQFIIQHCAWAWITRYPPLVLVSHPSLQTETEKDLCFVCRLKSIITYFSLTGENRRTASQNLQSFRQKLKMQHVSNLLSLSMYLFVYGKTSLGYNLSCLFRTTMKTNVTQFSVLVFGSTHFFFRCFRCWCRWRVSVCDGGRSSHSKISFEKKTRRRNYMVF